MQNEKFVIGVDYGTDSVRSLVVNVHTGEEVSSAVYAYPQWKAGMYCNASINQFRQHPKEYVDGLTYTIKEALANAPVGVAQHVVGITVDTTGSTPIAVNNEGTPLSLLPAFEENPNAMFILWKDHTALKEADEINVLSKKWSIDYTKYEGGIYSSEWFWAKVLHTIRQDDQVFKAAYSWVEHCDWIAGLLVGDTNPLTLKRSRCAAGHKAMWHEAFGGLPSEDFLVALDPKLAGLRDRLYSDRTKTLLI